jgi:predicted amidohydrolase YtcJ
LIEQCYAPLMRNLFLLLAGLFTCAAAASQTVVHPAPDPDWATTVLIHNVKGLQVGPDGKLDRFHSLSFDSRTGRVKRVFRAGEHHASRVVEAIDGGGRTLLPGLIDAHGHVMGLGFTATQLDLAGTTSLEDLQKRLRAYALANPRDPWIIGRGWNQELWPHKRFPTAGDLDAIVPDRPVVLERVDGHAIVVNSAALRAASVDATTPDVAGGEIERNPEGQPTGLLVDAAAGLVQNRVPAPTQAQLDRALAEAQWLMLENGLTAVADMGTTVAEWETFRRAGEAGKLNVRIMAYAADVEPMRALVPTGPTEWLYGDRLHMGGIKIYGDGALGSRGALLKQPYADKPDTSGLRFLTDDELRLKVDEAARRGIQPAIHAIGDAANAQAIATYEWLNQRYSGDRRWRIEHAQVIDPADIPRFAGGIIASMQPVHQTSDRLMAERAPRSPRLAGAYAWRRS